MTDPDIESEILRRALAALRAAEIADPTGGDRCTREIDLRDAIAELSKSQGGELDYLVRLWHARLAPEHTDDGILRPCHNQFRRNGDHRWHARAYIKQGRIPAQDRLDELEQQVPTTRPIEYEQKFGILRSLAQGQLDFANWKSSLEPDRRPLAVLFLDIDNFKRLNTELTESVVDAEILTPFQRFLTSIVSHRGGAYRFGGEEFLVWCR